MNLRRLGPEYYDRLPIYPPGKPIEETAREFGLAEDQIAKLASNENVLGPSPKAVAAIQAALPKLNLYPDGSAFYLKEALCRRYSNYGVTFDHLLPANGTNEVIELLMKSILQPDEKIAVWTPTFIIYELCCRSNGRQVVHVPMDPDFTYGVDAMIQAIESDPKIKMVFLANPNNPTGSWVGADWMGEFIQRLPSEIVFILDEAYKEFVRAENQADGISIALGRPRTLTMRTFSKAYGLAGIRVGYGIGDRDMVALLNKARAPFNCNSLAQAAAVGALEDEEFLVASRELVENQLPALRRGLEGFGVKTWDSQTNFLLGDFQQPFDPLFPKFLEEGVILRPMTGYGLPTFARVNIGTEANHHRLWAACEKILG
ncbi:MAG: histidinol-phosphate transaminase [Myxococcales bacterium]|nr:histidinol-phosphate transaminase [Myxococcales bacterium]